MNKRAGFTLLEIMVALGVMAVGISSVFALFAAATALHNRAVDEMNAALMADTVFGNIEARLFTAMTPVPAFINGSVTSFPKHRYAVRLVPVDNTDWNIANEFFVECQITWNVKGKKRIEKFHTILCRAVSYRERDAALVRRRSEEGEAP
jgi:prepilin-type N-terminal cleavage/methylation domain-containing protein